MVKLIPNCIHFLRTRKKIKETDILKDIENFVLIIKYKVLTITEYN